MRSDDLAEIGTAVHYNATTFSKNVGKWTNVGDVVLHVIHYDWWGNWQWQLEEVDTATTTPGEWYVDKIERKVYYWPTVTETLSEMSFAASQLSTIVSLRPSSLATGADSKFVRGVTFDGITFAHSTTTYLAEKYTVPSAGDWSILPKGAVTMSEGVIGALMSNCSWIQVGGNAVAFDGYVHDSAILDGDFIQTGDSGVVSVGQLPEDAPHDGTGFETFPTNNTVARCHFGSTGNGNSSTQEWNRIDNNFVMVGPKMGALYGPGLGPVKIVRMQ
eukprot:gene6914-1195_t